MDEEQFAYLFTNLINHLIVILLQKTAGNVFYDNRIQFLLYHLNRQPLISTHILRKKNIPASFNVCKKLIKELFENLTYSRILEDISKNLLIIQIKDIFRHKVIVHTSFLKIDPFESIVKKDCQYSIVIGLELTFDATIYDLREYFNQKYNFQTSRIAFYDLIDFKSYGNNVFIRDIKSFHNGSPKSNIIEIRAFYLPNQTRKLMEIGRNLGSVINLSSLPIVVINRWHKCKYFEIYFLQIS